MFQHQFPATLKAFAVKNHKKLTLNCGVWKFFWSVWRWTKDGLPLSLAAFCEGIGEENESNEAKDGFGGTEEDEDGEEKANSVGRKSIRNDEKFNNE